MKWAFHKLDFALNSSWNSRVLWLPIADFRLPTGFWPNYQSGFGKRQSQGVVVLTSHDLVDPHSDYFIRLLGWLYK